MLAAPIPPSLTYIPDFVSVAEEENLLFKVNTAPLPKWTKLSNRRLQTWGCTPLAKNNTALYEPLPPWLATIATRISIENPTVFVFDSKSPQETANNCLVNEYLPGQGIMPHLDGPAYKPTVATVSLGEYTILEFYKRRNLDENLSANDDNDNEDNGEEEEGDGGNRRRKPDFRFLLKPRSLVILKDDMYDAYLHGISDNVEDFVTRATINNWVEAGMDAEDESGVLLRRTQPRVSLTFRVAAKVSKISSLFGKKR
ncbi:hypothetical protein BDR26DRAFT_898986 [Obelidium mucronatum]|nr:hypothetical protein BDR26DRAFT_898986 [Obelidium mucronatum]